VGRDAVYAKMDKKTSALLPRLEKFVLIPKLHLTIPALGGPIILIHIYSLDEERGEGACLSQNFSIESAKPCGSNI